MIDMCGAPSACQVHLRIRSRPAHHILKSAVFSRTDLFLFYRGVLLYAALGLDLGTVPVDTVLASYYGSRY